MDTALSLAAFFLSLFAFIIAIIVYRIARGSKGEDTHK